MFKTLNQIGRRMLEAASSRDAQELRAQEHPCAVAASAGIMSEQAKHPRNAANARLQSLWRKHDVTDSVVQFLDLHTIASLPVLAQSFAAGHLRLLCAAGTSKLVKRAIMDGLANSGRDTVYFHERWDSGWLVRWRLEDMLSPQRRRLIKFTLRATVERDSENRNHLLLKGSTHDNESGLLFDFSGEHNRVESLRFRCRFEARQLAEGPGGSYGALILRSTNGNMICHVACFILNNSEPLSSIIKSVNFEGFAGQQLVLCKGTVAGEWNTVETKFDWDSSMASVFFGGQLAGTVPFSRLPLGSVGLYNWKEATSRFGDIEVKYSRGSPSRLIFDHDPAPNNVDSDDSDGDEDENDSDED